MYDMPLYRPPSEGNSLIIQITLGCSHNKCTFCNMYKSKKFSIKSLDVIKREIDEFRRIYSRVDRIFLADGDPLIIDMDKLREILIYINKVFSEASRITTYASSKSINLKTVDELKELRSLGLTMIYMGIESGSDKVLYEIEKGVTKEEIIKASKKIKESNIDLSVTVISGIGGRAYSKEHSISTGRLISEIAPKYLGVLSLMIEKDTPLYEKIRNKEFTILKDKEILEEIKVIIENIECKENIVFRSNHASNYLSLKGNLVEDKERLIREIDLAIERDNLKKEYNRRL